MSHEDGAKTQVGFGNVSYLWPAFAGDTFTKTFTMASVRNTSDGNHSVSTTLQVVIGTTIGYAQHLQFVFGVS